MKWQIMPVPAIPTPPSSHLRSTLDSDRYTRTMLLPPPPSLPYAWAFWAAAIAIGAGGLMLILWALFWDRSRGRRRCPKCSYDMSRTSGTTCPECGRSARHEMALFRTRRRWKWAAASLFLLAGAVALTLTPFIRSPQWWRFAPTTVLIPLALPSDASNADAVEGELTVRLQNTRVRAWHQRWITRRAARFLREHTNDTEVTRALQILQKVGPDGVAAMPAVLPYLESEDFIHQVLAWGTLAHIGVRDADAARRINAFLTDPASDNTLRQRITNRLGDNGAESACAIPSLVQIIERPELHTARKGFIIGAAAYTLGQIGPPAVDALPTLRTLAADASKPIAQRYAAKMAIALITREVENDIEYHVKGLTDPDVEIRRWASNCLSDYDILLNGLAAIRPLLKALQDPDPAVQANTQLALGAMIMQDPRSLKELKRIADGANAGLAALATETIKRGGRSTAVGFAVPAPPPPPAPPSTTSPATPNNK